MEEISSEDFWRQQINALNVPLPEIGSDPPASETEQGEKKVLIGGIDPDSAGNFSKITIDVYFFLNPATNKYFMMQTQNMMDYGEISFKKATEIVKRKQRRNKGGS